MQKAQVNTDVIASGFRRIHEISRTTFGSEDDLINKVVLPFFQVIGYGPDSFELKFPVHGYRPSRPGRKPEADCVFFSAPKHDEDSSLVVAEIKRDDPEFPEQQARFYSTNLFAPFYIAWSGLAFEVWQVQNFRAPALVGRYQLNQMDGATFAELKELLAPSKVVEYCAETEIKIFDFDDRREKIEARYLDGIAADLRLFKALDLPQIRDLDAHYVELGLREHDVVPVRAVKEEIEQGEHPEAIVRNPGDGRTFRLRELLETELAMAIIGDPGSGKSTLLRHVCLDNAYADSRLLPILVSIKELSATGETLVDYALRQIALYGNTDNPRYLYDDALAKGRILLCVDGIDELGIDEPKDARAAVVRFNAELSTILGRNEGNRIVITARRESWPACRPLLSQSLREFVVVPLTRSAVRIFVSKWFAESTNDSERVIDALRARDWPSYTTNPLLLTLTCACIPAQGELPRRASELYDRFLSFILEQWDKNRRITDNPPVPGLAPEVALHLLSALALTFHLQHQAAFTRSEIIDAIYKHLSLLPAPAPMARDVFLELTKQHGMLRSWSIDQYYAFPHLSLQAHLAVTALRSRADGHRIILDHKHDPFWREATLLYAELGDISDLARDLLATADNLLASDLLLLADCWAAGGEIRDASLSTVTVQRLVLLAKSENAFLADQAICVLARIPAVDARTALAGMMRNPDGTLAEGTGSRFAVLLFGESILEEIVGKLVRTGNDEDLLENFAYLPRRVAVERLRELVLRTDWPKKSAENDPGIRHLRRKAEELMAKVGEDLAVSPLKQLMSAPQLSDFEKSGCVSALVTIDDPGIPHVLREIVAGDFPIDCRIDAAGDLAPNEPEARRFLLKVMADESQDYFDRRDAAGELANFKGFTDDDLSAFRALIFDLEPVFVGGPNVAVSTVGTIGTKASLALLNEAREFWNKSDYEHAPKIREAITQALSLEDKSTDLRAILEGAGADHWINIELPRVAAEYYRRMPKQANELFVTALRSDSKEFAYAGTVPSAVFAILPQTPLTDTLLEAAIEFARKHPKDTYSWSALARVWRRRDISIAQRVLFSQ
jgi:hypothetical protein